MWLYTDLCTESGFATISYSSTVSLRNWNWPSGFALGAVCATFYWKNLAAGFHLSNRAFTALGVCEDARLSHDMEKLPRSGVPNMQWALYE